MIKELITIKQAANQLGVSDKTLYRWISNGTLPCVRFGKRTLRIEQKEISQFVENSRSNLTDNAEQFTNRTQVEVSHDDIQR